ncbi:acetate--CoA ligase family protein [Gymnodinialimonas hymeniacidonis]|uniref:acetate--CoA ligase family protein n=1 Tax=Gymnodinialimonas hymeniacidonis TaxID=3126508 RepID=UPI0034C60029
MRDLSRLLRPRSIAVIGGGAWCENVIREARAFGFKGPIWPVHPTRTTVAGECAVADVSELPDAPDASFVGVNRHATVEIIRSLAARGAGGAVCFASGFLEASEELADGGAVQDALLDAAGDMPIFGPNCYGFINGLDGTALWPDQHGMVQVDRGIAIITQSSNIALNLTMQKRGLPIAYLLTAGNQAQVDLAELGMAALADNRVTALGLHIEGIGDLRRFEALAEAARRLGKPIVALKIGASEQAQTATISHTASLAGSAAGSDALLARLGIRKVTSLSLFLEVLKLLHVTGPLASARIASMSCSGGEASLMADTALSCGVEFPALNASQEGALRKALGPQVSLANPLDYHTYIWGDRAAMAATFSAMMDPSLSIGCVVLDFPRGDRCDASMWDIVIDAIQDATRESGKPITVVSSLPETLPEEIAAELIADGIPPLCGLDDALSAIALAAQPPPSTPGDPVLTPVTMSDMASIMLTEVQAKTALSAHGLGVPKGFNATSSAEAGRTAQSLQPPMVLKGVGFAHKSENGAVALNLHKAKDVSEAADRMPTTEFLLEEMITDGVADLLVGVVSDPAHGFVLTLGAGGTLTELLADTVHLLLPVGPTEIEAAVDGLTVAPLLAGFRGAHPTNRQSIVNAVLAVQDYVIANAAQVLEVEVNPLICTPTRAVAADALIRLRDTQ